MMKRFFSILLIFSVLFCSMAVFAYNDTAINFLVNGKTVSFAFSPVIRGGVTYVDAKALSQSLGLTFTKYRGHESVVISNSLHSVCLTPDENYATVADRTGTSDKEFSYKLLTAPCVYIKENLAVAARDIASIFGYALSYNSENNTVYFGYAPQMVTASTINAINEKAYYFQNQAEFQLPSNGSGYCWVCSYAMIITNLTGLRITPSDIAAINLTKNSNGAYCYHHEIVSQLGLKFAAALPTTSVYYAGTDDKSGGTYINNPEKDDSVVRKAIKEALALHPEGVMVRYASYPHTMVAVACEGDFILFNDPAPSGSGTYSDVGRYQGVPFNETCVAKKGFALSDITFIQALDIN